MRYHHIYINYFLKRGRSFVYAWQGIVSLFGNEPNARIHLCVALVFCDIMHRWSFYGGGFQYCDRKTLRQGVSSNRFLDKNRQGCGCRGGVAVRFRCRYGRINRFFAKNHRFFQLRTLKNCWSKLRYRLNLEPCLTFNYTF